MLIFLVLTTTFRDAATFRVNLPPAETSEREVPSQSETLTILVAEDGSMEIDGKESNIDQLSDRLAPSRNPTERRCGFAQTRAHATVWWSRSWMSRDATASRS